VKKSSSRFKNPYAFPAKENIYPVEDDFFDYFKAEEEIFFGYTNDEVEEEIIFDYPDTDETNEVEDAVNSQSNTKFTTTTCLCD